MQVWCGVQMEPNVSSVLVLVYLLLFPGNTHFYSVNCGYSVSDLKKKHWGSPTWREGRGAEGCGAPPHTPQRLDPPLPLPSPAD